jgi:DNA-binding SARP family transcriptional activator
MSLGEGGRPELSRAPDSVEELLDENVGAPSRRLALLGAFELRLGCTPVALPAPAQRILAFLALQNRPLLRTYVAGVLWLDSGDVQSQGSLRSGLWRLRSVSEDLVETRGQQLRLAPDVAVDVHLATTWARRLIDSSADAAGERPDPAFLGVDLLPDWYDDWLLIERERFRELRAHALECLCERLTSAHRYAAAMETALTAVAAEPLRESAHRAVINVCLAEGNLAHAFRHYQAFAKLLHEEVGVRPSSRMEELVGLVMAG